MKKSGFKDYRLSEELINALQGLRYDEPTEVQDKVIPLALDKKNLIVKSQTGSGKTAAYAIPICELLEWLENKPQALILTPTRELAVQVRDEFTNIGRFKRIKAAAIYGGQPFSRQKTELGQKTHVVVGTPGRVLDHIEKGTLTLNNIKYLVIDEADRMLDMGFLEQVESILKELPEEPVTMLFSATIPEQIKAISTKYIKCPINIDISEEEIAAADIEHFLYMTEDEDKITLLKDITTIENPDSCIIFCETKERVDMVHGRLAKLGYPCKKIHGGMVQKDRLRIMNGFKRGEFRYLIATDVIARGIDVEEISLVINFDLPLDKANYIHRTGRTARSGRKGKAITFIMPTQKRYLNDIEDLVGVEIERRQIPSKEEVLAAKASFDDKIKAKPQIKTLKSEQLNKDIMKLRFNGGKKKKLRATNFVWAITNVAGVSADDIGIIDISDTLTHVEILNGKGQIVLEAMKNTKIGNKKLRCRVIK